MSRGAKLSFLFKHLIVHAFYSAHCLITGLLEAPRFVFLRLFRTPPSSKRDILLILSKNKSGGSKVAQQFGLATQHAKHLLTYDGPLYNGHVHTILGNLRVVSNVPYQRERVTSIDGQPINLDFLLPRKKASPGETSQPKGLLFVLPGLFNASTTNYVRHFAMQAAEMNWATCILNYRGMGTTPLEVPRLFSATYTDDVRYCLNTYLQHEQVREKLGYARHDTSHHIPIIGIGFSLGGITLVKYISEEGKTASEMKNGALHRNRKDGHEQQQNAPVCPLDAAVAVTSPFDLIASDRQTETWHYHHLYEKPFTLGLRKYMMHNQAIIERLPGITTDELFRGPRPLVNQLTSVRKFDAVINAPHNGFSTPQEYYAAANAIPWLAHCCTPVLCISNRNDPVCGPPVSNEVWQELADRNENVLYACMPVGGHLGFLGGPLQEWRSEPNAMEKLVLGAVDAFGESMQPMDITEVE